MYMGSSTVVAAPADDERAKRDGAEQPAHCHLAT